MTTTAKKRVTINEIAREAGVAASTISKVLNGNHDVSTATRQRVQAILSERNYQRRSSAPKGPLHWSTSFSRNSKAHGQWRSCAGRSRRPQRRA